MRPIVLFGTALSLAACAGGGERAGGDAATLDLADVAGSWTVRTMAEGSDSVIVTSQINATATTEGWTMVLPGRDPIPLHVIPGGDSVVTHAGPYESVLRPGVQVSIESVMRLENDQWVGTTVARYQGAGRDSVVKLRASGTRMPQ